MYIIDFLSIVHIFKKSENIMTYASLVDFSNFFIEKITCKNCCNFFLCEFYRQKLAKFLQKFLLIRPNFVDFFRFSQLLVEVKDAKNEICINSDNSSIMVAIWLKICTKQSEGKWIRIFDTRSHLCWGTFLHWNLARPFQKKIIVYKTSLFFY